MGNIVIKNKGFTLIETFVAIGILLVVVIGPMSMLSRSLAENNSLKNKMAAGYLAQEGIELMIALRNYRSAWVTEGCYNSVYYDNIYTSGPTVTALSSCTPQRLYTINELQPDGINMTIGYTPNVTSGQSIFNRMISVERIGGPGNAEFQVTSKVVWQEKGRSPQVVLVTDIFK